MRKTRKPLAAAIALALVAALGVGATLAWLTDEESATNTFTVGNIDIDLWEHDYDPEANALTSVEVKANADYKMVPGTVLPKDPTVTVKAGSEDCWLFVKVEEIGGDVSWTEKDAEGKDVEQNRTFSDFISYTVDPNNWAALLGANGVYYCYAEDIDENRLVKVLGYTDADGAFHANQVKVKDTVTKEMMDALEADGAVLPQLTFTAYAVQMAGFDSAAEAWEATFGKPSATE